MLFNSSVYFLFLTIVVLVYWRLPWRAQNVFLVAASYFFYGWWDWRFLSLMLASTLVDFYVAKGIASYQNPVQRRTLLIISLVLNFTFLGFFKYCNFFIDSLATTLLALGVHNVPRHFLEIVLPPGISFYTFQAVAYVVDVYHKKLEPAESLVDYALFISFFPHLIAGPIQRPDHLLPQTQRPRIFHSGAFFDGLCLIVSGLFQKVVIADNCAILANAAFAGQFGKNGWAALLGVYAFAWQIYGDFSAYSNFARGSAQLMGFHFMVNFRQPYLATTLQDFWRRWHVSLSTWLRDYLYIGLGGNRKGERRTYINLMTTMLLGGLWHGANWTFVVWGAIHGVGLAIERFTLGRWKEWGHAERGWTVMWLQRVFVFHVVCLSWVFFRAPSLKGAGEYLEWLSRWNWHPAYGPAMVFLGCLGMTLLLSDLRLENHDEEYVFERTPEVRRVVLALAGLALTIIFSASESNAFIYFQF